MLLLHCFDYALLPWGPNSTILRPRHWEYIGHAVPNLPGENKYNLQGGNAYVKGIFASTMKYRASNKQFYWIGCIEYSRTYVYTSTSVTNTWTPRSEINTCYYDCGLLIDRWRYYVCAYGNTQISVAQVSVDGLSQVKTQVVYNTLHIGTLEGSRMYKIKGCITFP